MLELSLAECAFIALIAFIFIGPKELPGAFRAVNGFVKSVRGVVADVKTSFAEIADETGVSEVKRELEEDARYIKDLEGNMQRVYDVNEIHDSRKQDEA